MQQNTFQKGRFLIHHELVIQLWDHIAGNIVCPIAVQKICLHCGQAAVGEQIPIMAPHMAQQVYVQGGSWAFAKIAAKAALDIGLIEGEAVI